MVRISLYYKRWSNYKYFCLSFSNIFSKSSNKSLSIWKSWSSLFRFWSLWFFMSFARFSFGFWVLLKNPRIWPDPVLTIVVPSGTQWYPFWYIYTRFCFVVVFFFHSYFENFVKLSICFNNFCFSDFFFISKVFKWFYRVAAYNKINYCSDYPYFYDWISF